MRTIVDLPEAERAQLDGLCCQRGLLQPRRGLRPVAGSPGRVSGAATGAAAGVGRALMLLLDTNILIDVLRGEAIDFPLTLGGVLHPYQL